MCSLITRSVSRSSTWSTCPSFSTASGKLFRPSLMKSLAQRYIILECQIDMWTKTMSYFIVVVVEIRLSLTSLNLVQNLTPEKFDWDGLIELVLWLSADWVRGQEESAGDSSQCSRHWPTTHRIWRRSRTCTFARCYSTKLAAWKLTSSLSPCWYHAEFITSPICQYDFYIKQWW